MLAGVLLWGAAGPGRLIGVPDAGAAERALADFRFETSLADQGVRTSTVGDFTDLHTRWVRLDVFWSALEPTSGVYDPSQLALLDAAVDELKAAGIKVMFTVYGLPVWAQDHSYRGFSGAAQPIRDDALDDFGRLGEFLASHFSGRVRALECWNEPNLWPFLYPQRTADDAYFAPRLYLRMLKAFYAGVQRGDADMLVVAGATGPLGPNDRNRTSPQRFARFLADHGAAAYFDVYSHHPYTPGGSLHPQPEAAAQRPDHDRRPAEPADPAAPLPHQALLPDRVRLQHELRRVFGGSRSTRPSRRSTCARLCLRGALQTGEAAVWFLVRDAPPLDGKPPEYGVYTGLRKTNGDRKLSWFAFAGGNRITIDCAVPRSPRPRHPHRRQAHEQLDRSAEGAPAGAPVPAPRAAARGAPSGAPRRAATAPTTST